MSVQKYYDYLLQNSKNVDGDATADPPAATPRVLVHCVAGINRSGLIACAAQMVLERQPLLEVVRYCIKQRGSVLWNRSFQRQLCQLCQLTQGEGLLGPPCQKDTITLSPMIVATTLRHLRLHTMWWCVKKNQKLRLSQLLQSTRSRIAQTESEALNECRSEVATAFVDGGGQHDDSVVRSMKRERSTARSHSDSKSS